MDVVKSESSHSGRRSRGFTLVIVMLIVTILTISGTSLLFMSYHSCLRAINLGEETASRVLTDSGLRMAIGTLNAQYRNGTLNDNDLPMSVGETVQGMTGTFSYQITKDANGVYVVTSVGAQGDFRRVEVAKLELHTDSYFDNAILAKGSIDIAPGMTVAAYNPGDPNAPVGTYPATIGTTRTNNGDVDVSGTLYGDAFCGVDGSPALCITGQANITGSAYALTDEPNIVRPVMPGDIPYYGTIFEVDSETVTLTPADSGIYSQIKLTKKATPAIVYIDGGTVSLGSTDLMQMGMNCQIIVNEGSTLLLYLGENLSAMSGASFSYNSATIDPTHIQIYGTGDAAADGVDDYIWALKSNDVLQCVVYAPDAFISLNAGSSVYGAIVCSSLSGSSDMEYLYDTSLATATNIALSGEPVGYDVNRWSESTTSSIPEWAQ